MNQSEHLNELAKALSKAQAEMQPAIKDSINPHFKSKFADLTSIWNACREPLTKNGLSVAQAVQITENGSYYLETTKNGLSVAQAVQITENGSYYLETTLIHSSGQWMRSCCPIIMTKQDMQGLGSAISYSRRYSLASICGVCTDDDDGNAACAPAPRPPVGKISVGQIKQLSDLIGTSPEDLAYKKKVLDYYELASLDELSLTHFDAVLQSAQKRRSA